MCVPPFLPGGSEAVGCVRVVVVLLCVAVGVVHIRSLRAPAWAKCVHVARITRVRACYVSCVWRRRQRWRRRRRRRRRAQAPEVPLHSRGAMDELEKDLEKGIGWLLKHGAVEKGLELLDGGFVRLDSALHVLSRSSGSGGGCSPSIEVVKHMVKKSRRRDGTPRFELTTCAELRTIHPLTPDCLAGVSDKELVIRHTTVEDPQQVSRLSKRASVACQSRSSMLGSSESWRDVEDFKTSLGLENPLLYGLDSGEELLAVRAASKAGEKEGALKKNASILLERVGIKKDDVKRVRDEVDTVRHAFAAGFPTQVIDMHVMLVRAKKAGLRAIGIGPHEKGARHAAYVAIAATAASTEGFIGHSMLEIFYKSASRPEDIVPPEVARGTHP